MELNFKHIHLGNLIKQKVDEIQLDHTRICKFLHCNEIELQQMFSAESLDSDIILKWSKLLEYDLFRIYSQHLILFSPPQKRQLDKRDISWKSSLPVFKKNIYTIEIIEFILEMINTGAKTKAQIIDEYNIPKTTLHRWMVKYQVEKNSMY
ncbi:hypothetical protein CHRYSEOSP005_32220 [Chryseobacterium sp. Alg-005]|uniref:transposase n=1 Tax=Chryseobacterium sp. Alg-005 TaxID=3159516 RepID=UPI003555983F